MNMENAFKNKKLQIFHESDTQLDMPIIHKSFECGYCGRFVVGNELIDAAFSLPYSYAMTGKTIGLFTCPSCQKPTFIDEVFNNIQVPLPKKDNEFNNIPSKLNRVYQEVLDAYSVEAFTATTLLCRKLLMSMAVDLGAKENQTFAEYIKFLDDGYIPRNYHKWVDRVIKINSQATHNLDINSKEEADMNLLFCKVVLLWDYEMPNRFKTK